MQFTNTFVAIYAVALAGFAAAQSTMTVNTPASVVQCQPVALTWSGGTAPYFPSIIPGKQPGAAALKEFPSQQATSLTWVADLAAGTSITLQIRDSTGSLQYSSDVVIQTSSDSSCVNGSVSATASGTGAPAPTQTATTPAGSTAAGSSAASASTAPAGSSSSAVSRTSAAPSASSSPNSASAVAKGSFGVAALAGLIGAALF